MRKCAAELHGPGRHRADELPPYPLSQCGVGIGEETQKAQIKGKVRKTCSLRQKTCCLLIIIILCYKYKYASSLGLKIT